MNLWILLQNEQPQKRKDTIMNIETAWRALQTRERAIDAELRKPGVSQEWRERLEIEKKKVEIEKRQLIRKGTDGGGQRDRTEENRLVPNSKSSELDEKKVDSNDLRQSQIRQARQGRDHLRELEIQKWAERQRS